MIMLNKMFEKKQEPLRLRLGMRYPIEVFNEYKVKKEKEVDIDIGFHEYEEGENEYKGPIQKLNIPHPHERTINCRCVWIPIKDKE